MILNPAAGRLTWNSRIIPDPAATTTAGLKQRESPYPVGEIPDPLQIMEHKEEERPFLDSEQKLESGRKRHAAALERRQPRTWLWLSASLNAVLFGICVFLVFLLALKQNADSIAEPYCTTTVLLMLDQI